MDPVRTRPIRQWIRIENFTSVLIFGHLAKSAHVRDVNFPSIWRLNVNSHSDRIGSAVDSVLFTPTQNVIRQHTWRSKFPQKKLWPQAAMYGWSGLPFAHKGLVLVSCKITKGLESLGMSSYLARNHDESRCMKSQVHERYDDCLWFGKTKTRRRFWSVLVQFFQVRRSLALTIISVAAVDKLLSIFWRLSRKDTRKVPDAL